MGKRVASTTRGFDPSCATNLIGDESPRDDRDRRGLGKEMAGKARFVHPNFSDKKPERREKLQIKAVNWPKTNELTA